MNQIAPILPTPSQEMHFGPHASGPTILSILVPFYHDDPCDLIAALSEQALTGVELVLYDDGSADKELYFRIITQAGQSRLPVKLISAPENRGRSHARNALVQAAKGQYLLFLDADMLPTGPDLLRNYCQEIQNGAPAVVFGGFQVPKQAGQPDQELHRAISQTSDCLSAEERAKLPAKHVCTSNLLVRKDVLAANPFDTDFHGWGWEDVEWAARVAEHNEIRHVDNAALHLGLESAESLVRRYRDSAANYALFVSKHPQLARQLPTFRTAKLARKLPGLRMFRPWLAKIAAATKGPMGLRILALKLWRASWYGEKLA